MVLVQRGAINIRPLPQETFDFYRYHTSFHIMYSIVSSKTYIGTGRGLPYHLDLFCHYSNLLLDGRQRTYLVFAYFDIKKCFMECKYLLLLDIYSALVLYYTILTVTVGKNPHLDSKKKKKKTTPEKIHRGLYWNEK